MAAKTQLFWMTVVLISTIVSLSGQAQEFDGTSLSSTTPPYGAPPYRYQGSQLVSIVFETSPEVLRALVPKPLAVAEGNIAIITIGLQKIVEPRPLEYYEAYIVVPVAHDGTKGAYLPVLYLDKVVPILAGREIYGFAKVDADIEFEKRDGKIHARVQQEGTTLIDAVVTLGEQVPPPPSWAAQPMFNLKLIPSILKDAPPDVMQLTSVMPCDATVTTAHRGEATLVLGSTFGSPLGKIPVRRIMACYYTESGFTLDYGQVVHDYLAEGKGKESLSKDENKTVGSTDTGRAGNLDPATAESLSLRGWTIIRRDPVSAVRLFRAAHELEPENWFPLSGLGTALLLMGQMADGVNELTQSTQLPQGANGINFFLWSIVQYYSGPQDEAVKSYQKGIAWKKDNTMNERLQGVLEAVHTEAARLLGIETEK